MRYTTLFGVDHAPSLTMVHTHLLRTMIEEKRAKLEQMGRNVFGLTDEENLAENTINTIEAFYLQMGTPIHFLTKEMSADEATDAILVKLAEKDFNALGENQTVTPVRVREVLLSSLKWFDCN